ncbi:hypothetical protein [Cupriavidus necator]|uniref:hypothetical protein n=1 Tax=Cupriavidus necator TaxID=106590 RepID=UPI001F43C489|nr:hypothetical protein [Cupriavidus necator]
MPSANCATSLAMSAAYVTDVPEGFPAWASVRLLYLGGNARAAQVDAVRQALLGVLRGIATASVRPQVPGTAGEVANDAAVALCVAG